MATAKDTYNGEALNNVARWLSDSYNINIDKVPNIISPTIEIRPTEGGSGNPPEPYPLSDMLVEYHKDYQEQNKSIIFDGELPYIKCKIVTVFRDEKLRFLEWL